MIPPLAFFLRAHANFARARGLDPRRDEALIVAALDLAVELSQGRAEDEPAALLDAAETTAKTGAKGTAEARDLKLKVSVGDQHTLRGYVQLVVDSNPSSLSSAIIASSGMSQRNVIPRSKPNLAASMGPTPRRTIHPPEWIGYALLSVGSVLVLHSLAMKKPGG